MSMLTLFRPPIALMTAVSALAGYALHPPPHGPVIAAFLAAGIFLLSAGCSAINQVQERDVDALMERTRHRPIASGRLSVRTGLALGIILAGCALLLLAAAGSRWAAGLGLFALFWYNGVYTPLKRITPWALLPGAVCGALPPMIGWTAVGGHPADFRIILLAGLLFLWQIPHFLFFAQKHREDFLRCGLPTFFSCLSLHQINRLALIWVFSLACATLLLPAFGLLRHPAALLTGLAAVAWLAINAARPGGEPFARLNGALCLLLLAVLVEGLG